VAATTETMITTDLVREANDIIIMAISPEVTDAIKRAETCGCRGCKAQAMEAVEWARDMIEAERTVAPQAA